MLLKIYPVTSMLGQDSAPCRAEMGTGVGWGRVQDKRSAMVYTTAWDGLLHYDPRSHAV